MFTTRSRILVLACTTLMFGHTSCDDSKNDHGTLIVPFRLGNDLSCETFHVKTVHGELDNGHDDPYTDDAKCEAKELRFENVPSGAYKVRLFGYADDDDDANAVMDSLQNDELMMNVVGDGTTVIAEKKVMLTAAPAHLRIRWSFGFGTCKSAGISAFHVTVWKNDGSDLLLEDELGCEAVGDSDNDYYRKIPDDQRSLAGNEPGQVAVQPLNTLGGEIGDPLNYDYKAPGPGQNIELSVKCGKDDDAKAGVSCWPEKSTDD
jgi:hypothetical protein